MPHQKLAGHKADRGFTLVEALCAGQPLGIRLHFERKSALIADGSGDLLDAVICAVQAAWAAGRARYGMPKGIPAGEGWIVSAARAK